MRYAFDGDATLIVEDDRVDTSGSGSVEAKRCMTIQRSSWFPQGVDCEPVDHSGFAEAVG